MAGRYVPMGPVKSIDDVYRSKYMTLSDLNGQPFRLFTIREVRKFQWDPKEGQTIGDERLELFMYGEPRPYPLNSINAQRMAICTGTKNPEEWMGRTIRLCQRAEVAFGKTEPKLSVDETYFGGPALPGQYGGYQQTMVNQAVAQLPAGPKLPNFPRAAIDRFIDQAKAMGGSWDGLLTWAHKRGDAPLFELLFGKDLDSIGGDAGPGMRAYLEHLGGAGEPQRHPDDAVARHIDPVTGEVLDRPRIATALGMTPPGYQANPTVQQLAATRPPVPAAQRVPDAPAAVLDDSMIPF